MFSLKNNLLSDEIIAQHVNVLGILLANQANLVIDSRKINLGDVFCAYRGTANDGREYINSAIEKGAAAILYQPPYSGVPIKLENHPVENLMQLVGIFAAHKYGYPSKSIKNFAVTGTNGKTSITHWLNQAYAFLGYKTGIIGTTGAGVYPNLNDYASTTPDPVTLQQLLLKFKNAAIDVLAMEVSSHALHQGRVNGVNFDTAIFTNLTQDHLDYHQTMDNYFAAKEELFYWSGLKNAVINSDDPYGQKIIANLVTSQSTVNIISYGINSGDVRAQDINLSNRGCEFVLTYAKEEVRIYAPIIGLFNIYNLLAVIASLLANNINFSQIKDLIAQLKPVTGRMDAKIIDGKPLVVVDYAHTPDALEKALSTLKEIKGTGRLICVFGCGGNRDRSKRPLMGEAAAKYADKIILTTDNPRFEEPEAIIADILPAMANNKHYLVEVKREEAIHKAINMALADDVVLIAGKGHEPYQEVKGTKYPFSDLEIVQQMLANRAFKD
ncbi:UDP-N-acetylmuramoyl-L-alanyl-D-glutamate--2,6-diaminopimelate ligase [Aquella oligotrophica]|uniref:UDP-N-acetylmuramoyl-L-alanyl-D-glutamate--2, 6-diaminopimelate ligase n=1 Tax=Aquella oligotrophica TaxID=2067065 RepID=UPI001FE672CF|nr:UDP-N-acetylmuramoyl-L-alanyl-D-glutamate--2,6-diaminopimelate ligase [Aquella oligotrophica]